MVGPRTDVHRVGKSHGKGLSFPHAAASLLQGRQNDFTSGKSSGQFPCPGLRSCSPATVSCTPCLPCAPAGRRKYQGLIQNRDASGLTEGTAQPWSSGQREFPSRPQAWGHDYSQFPYTVALPALGAFQPHLQASSPHSTALQRSFEGLPWLSSG